MLTNCGQPGESPSNDLAVNIKAASPEFFCYGPVTDGKRWIAATGRDAKPSGPTDIIPGAVPAAAGDTLSLNATGFGRLEAPFTAGIARKSACVRHKANRDVEWQRPAG